MMSAVEQIANNFPFYLYLNDNWSILRTFLLFIIYSLFEVCLFESKPNHLKKIKQCILLTTGGAKEVYY